MSEAAVGQLDANSAVTQAISQWCASATAGQFELEAYAFARHCLLDFLGVAFSGAEEEGTALLRTELLDGEVSQSGAATLFGGVGRTSALNAAMVNGTAAHALDFDDVHFDLPGHPTVAIMPAVLAAAERDGMSLQAVLDAFIVGVEAACAVGRFMTHSHYQVGWHGTGTVGAVGAAAGVAKLKGLDASATARAMGLAVSQCGGLKSMFGTMCKPLHAGKAAYHGLLSASLASRGFTARTDMLECPQGFAAAFSGESNAQAALDGLSGNAAIRGILFKYHAACYGTHACIDAMLKLKEEFNVDADAVQRVDLTVPEENLRICDIKAPSTGLEAKFSMTVTSAMALRGIPTGDVQNYSEETCARADVVDIRDRININSDPTEFRPVATASAHLADGIVHVAHADVGIPETDLDRQARRLADKFELLARPLHGDGAGALAERVLTASDDAAIGSVLEGC